MNRLKYPQKFALVSLLFCLPLAWLVYLLWSELQIKSEFTRKELMGTEYLRRIRQLNELLPQIEFLSQSDPDRHLSLQELKQQQANIEQAIAALAEIDQQLGQNLQTSEQFRQVSKSWQAFKATQTTGDQAKQLQNYAAMLDQLNRLMTQVGNGSNLILDPQLNSYYLASSVLIHLPHIQNVQNRLRILEKQKSIQANSAVFRLNNSIAQQKEAERRAAFSILLGSLQEDQQALKQALTFASQGQDNTAVRELTTDLQQLSDLLNWQRVEIEQWFNSKSQPQSTPAIKSIDTLLTLSFQLWDRVIPELENVLQHRLQGYTQQQQMIALFILIILILVIYLFSSFYQSVMQTVQGLEVAAQVMAEGKIEYDLKLRTQDELAQVVRSFNKIAAALVRSEQAVKQLNQRLTADNLAMRAKLEILRQIQQLILPNPEELEAIEGLDIAGYMEPADEVGGDYYDVLYDNGVVTIGIGDVTGHGLESSILMVMTQTAVRTLKEVREVDPVRFLDTLNRTIYKNVKRMNSKKNLTLVILNYAQGQLSISGQHEEAIVVREGGAIERIDTIDLGFPIALDAKIADFINHTLVTLHPGDGVVLYTDGITEAEDMNRNQYGIEKLCDMISQNWHRSAQEIKEAVISDVRHHIGVQKVFDDITLLVLKRQPSSLNPGHESVNNSPEFVKNGLQV